MTPEQERTKSFSTWAIISSWTTIIWGNKTPVLPTKTWSITQTGSSTWTGNTTWTGALPMISVEEEEVLHTFKQYQFKKLLVHPALFDLTPEYPDEYLEYYSENLTLYMFSTKKYREIVSIFEAFTTQLPFAINKTNTAGENSFFINLKPELDDYVRIVFEYKQKVFWLKIKKDEYNKVRIMLKNLQNAGKKK
jgi:hypothetical protein